MQTPDDSARRERADQQFSTLARPTAERVQTAAPDAAALEKPAQERLREADAAPAEAKAAAAAPPVPASAPPLAATQAAGNAAAESAATPQPQTAPAAPQRSRLEDVSAASARLASAARDADARLPVASPDGVSRWRIVGPVLEMSADGGATWLPAAGVTPAEVADVTSGASPARGVSWLVGRSGLVLRTTDGRRFSRTSTPAPALLIGVEAADGAIAEVRASDGRAWRTVNAGRTWMPVR